MAHADDKVRFTRALPARHLPSSGFGCPLDGLLPRQPCPPCFRPAAPLGFSLRSLSPTRVFAASSTANRPACRYGRSRFKQTSRSNLADRRPASGFYPRRIPNALHGCLARKDAGNSLGLWALQGSGPIAWASPSTRLLPRAWPSRRLPGVMTPRLGVSISDRLARPRGPSALPGVPAPQSPWHSTASPVRAMCSPRATVPRHRKIRPRSEDQRSAYRSCQGD